MFDINKDITIKKYMSMVTYVRKGDKRKAMNTLGYVLLSLLAREPMSGYDLTAQLKKRFAPFWPISHTQIYPALRELEEQGFCFHQLIEQHATRPDKKVYEITEKGKDALRQWVESPTPLVVARDEFFLKAYSLWLADPERMMEVFRDQVQLHEERLAFHEHNLQAKRSPQGTSSDGTNFLDLTELLFQYAIGYERNYISWCQSALHYLEQRKHIQEEEQ
jgi:DNA-binding PadR family transcriptional regulator